MGNQAHAIAMMFWLKHATESAGAVGLIMMLSTLPGVILGPIGGTIADRYSRKWIIVGCDLISGTVVISLAIVMFVMPDAVNLLVGWLATVAVLMAVVSAVFRPAISASIPELVPKEKLATANSFNQSSGQIAGLAGQSAGGVLFRVLGAPILFLADGITFLVSAFCTLFIRIPQTLPEKAENMRQVVRVFLSDTGEGFRYIWQRKGIRDLFFAATFLNFFLSPISVLLPFFIEDHLHASSDWFGYFIAAIGAGAMVGYLAAGASKASGKARTILVLTTLFLDSLAIGALGLVTDKVVALGLGFVIGFLNGIVNIEILTVMQLTTPSEIRGRVFGVLGTIAGGLAPLGMGLAGIIADLANQNIPAIFLACGGITAACSLLVALSREFREFMAYETKPRAAS